MKKNITTDSVLQAEFYVLGFPDFYRILGLPRFYPTKEEIDVAFMESQRNVLANHLLSLDVKSELMNWLNNAHTTLSDTGSKRAYDEVLEFYIQHEQNSITSSEKNGKAVVYHAREMHSKEECQNKKTYQQNEKSFNKKIDHSKRNIFDFETKLAACSILLLFLIGLVYFHFNSSYISDRDSIVSNITSVYSTPTPTPAPTMIPVFSRPQNGQVFTSRHTDRDSEFEVETRGERDYYVKLIKDMKYSNDIVVASFYIRGGMSVSINVPTGTYVLRYACGDGKNWIGTKSCFGEETIYVQADDPLTFTEYSGWTVELYLQPNGNMSTHTIDASEF